MYQKIFPAELEHLYEMLEFIEAYGHTRQIPSAMLDRIILATEEALVNIVSYGYPDQKKGTIEIVCEETKPQAGINIIIKDQGIPFNPIEKVPTSPPPPAKIENSLGGYGIYILIGLMDHVEYQRLNEGNILSLTKYL